MLEPLFADHPGQTFFIVGTGASVNGLTPPDWQAIAAGRSLSINMGILAPVAFDLCSFEFMPNAFWAETVARHLRARGRGVLWVEDRPAHRSPFLDGLAAEFPMHRYAPVDVSHGGQAALLRRVWRAEMRAVVRGGRDLRLSYALIGSVARAVLLGLALGYRRICLVGIDQNANPYFWQEPGAVVPWHDPSGVTAAHPTSGLLQAGLVRADQSPDGVSLWAFLQILAEEEGLQLTLLDPARRSALSTAFPQWDGA